MASTTVEDVDDSIEEAATVERIKRPPTRLQEPNHVYVNRRQHPKALLKLVRRLFESQHFEEVFLHGMGATVVKAIHLGQDVLSHYGLDMTLETSIDTVVVVDDIMEEYEVSSEERKVPSITLHLRRRRLGDEPSSSST